MTGAAWTIDLVDARSDVANNNDGIARALGTALRSNVTETVAHYIRNSGWTDPKTDYTMSPFLLAALRHHGIDPARWMLARGIGMGFDFVAAHDDEPGFDTYIEDFSAPQLTGGCWLGTGVYLDASDPRRAEIIITRRHHGLLPETIRAGMAGRRIDETIAHPALTAANAIVVSVEPDLGRTLVTLAHQEPVPIGTIH